MLNLFCVSMPSSISDRCKNKIVDHRMIMICGIWWMVLIVTFNNVSVISWWPVLLVEETRVPGGKKH